MVPSKRLSRLGIGIFERYDICKQAYRFASLSDNSAPLLDLSLGSTDLLPPSIVLDAISQSLEAPESAAYCLNIGTKPFREVAADWCKKRFGVSVDPEKEVLLLIGSQEGTAHLPLAVLDPGQTGLILDPSYPSHRGGLVLADAKIETLTLHSEEDWKPDFRCLKASQLQDLGLMVFGYPHNPTSQTGKQSWLDEAMKLGLKNHFIVAHDNPYVDLVLDGEAPALLNSPGWKEGGIEFFSFSKAWNMGGFRLAFAIGAEPLISALRGVKSVVDFNQSLALQRGAIAALTKADDWPVQILSIYRKRRDTTIKALRSLGWNVPKPSMAMYLWMPLPSWAKNRGWNDETFSAKLLSNTGVALTPGSGFGLGGSGWLRLALVRPVDELEEAIHRIKIWWNANS